MAGGLVAGGTTGFTAGVLPGFAAPAVGGLAAEAGIADADGFARKWHILMKGSIISAAEGDREAARRAREIGTLILERLS